MEKKKKRKIRTRLLLEYKVDLTSMEGLGDFPCPKCRANLSPEDREEVTYSIKEIRTRKDRLEELAIKCNRCGSLIHLLGFAMLYTLE